ncbi:MAG: 2,5-diketo-D-gluconate reductase [Frankiaceae bacterium]|jgi:diketogulonate reductase-like aldo/keto reductase|nr:2,5-diketo-D-gluconate reductase [Frankiaceae bacterium]
MTEPVLPTEAAGLPNGGRMPLLGFGTWQILGDEATAATRTALAAGYRHVDTATVYDNEGEVGAALRDGGVRREDVFVTTKVPPHAAGRERETLGQSLRLLGTEYVDLWLIHWPPDDGLGLGMWEAMLRARDEGLVRDVGVSNYDLDQLDALGSATGVLPAVNQIRWSPLLYDAKVEQGHRERGVVLEGYSALRNGTLEHPVVLGIAERLGRTPAQVIIRWHIEHGVVVIPKSRNAERIRSNADVGGFTLSPDDVAALDALGT